MFPVRPVDIAEVAVPKIEAFTIVVFGPAIGAWPFTFTNVGVFG